MVSNAFLEICCRVVWGAIHRLRLYGVHPGFTLKYVIRFSSVLVFVLPMKIEIRLLIGRDFFADWLSIAFNFLPNREIFSRGLSAAARLFDYKTTMRRGSGSSHSAHIHFHPRTR